MTWRDLLMALICSAASVAISWWFGYVLGYSRGFTAGYECSQDRIDTAHEIEDTRE